MYHKLKNMNYHQPYQK